MSIRPKLTNHQEVNDFIRVCYSDHNAPDYKDYLHIFNSFDNYPVRISPTENWGNELKFSTNKFDDVLYITSKGVKYMIEFEEDYMNVFKQTAPRSRKFEGLKSYKYEDMFSVDVRFVCEGCGKTVASESDLTYVVGDMDEEYQLCSSCEG